MGLVALIAKNVHWLWSPDDALRQSAASRNRLIAIKTKLAFDGLRMIKSLIGMPALLGDT
jgi:hypothetical protein